MKVIANKPTLENFTCAPMCSASEALDKVKDVPGYYAIFVDKPNALGKAFSTRIPKTGLIYIGIASKSLRSRLTRQELRHKRPATFFRSLGAVLEFMPIEGSLAEKANKNNYRFSPSDTQEIVDWIDEHLLVSWVCKKPRKSEEKRLIQLHRPVFNIQHNPAKCEQVVELRRICKEHACATVNACA